MEQTYQYNQNIVIFGGGTGQFNLLRGLVCANNPSQITAVPGTWDSGGSSGRLRTELGVLPPGDARRCLIALMENDEQREIALQLFEDRMEGFGKTLNGQAVGNLIIAWLDRANGGNGSGLQAARKLFRVESDILHVSTNKLTLLAKYQSGKELREEVSIDTRGEHSGFDPSDRISSIYFETPPKVNPMVLEAIEKADKIVFAMGSMYTSILPHLLVPKIKEAIQASSAKVYLVLNIMTEKGQTDTFSTASAHLKEFLRYFSDPSRINFIIANANNHITPEVVGIYKKEGQEAIVLDEVECKKLAPNASILTDALAHYLKEEHLIRHDSEKLSNLILGS